MNTFKYYRLKAGLRVQQVKDVLNVSDAAVYYWETGRTKPHIDVAVKLARLYNCEITDLLKEDVDDEPPHI